MSTFFIPYSGDTPAAVEINGHRLLILASEPGDVEPDLIELGGTEVRTLEIEKGHENEAFLHLAEEIKGGVVLTPPGIPVSILIDSLERELPWVH